MERAWKRLLSCRVAPNRDEQLCKLHVRFDCVRWTTNTRISSSRLMTFWRAVGWTRRATSCGCLSLTEIQIHEKKTVSQVCLPVLLENHFEIRVSLAHSVQALPLIAVARAVPGVSMLTQHGRTPQVLTRRCAVVLGVLAVRTVWSTAAEALLYCSVCRLRAFACARTLACSQTTPRLQATLADRKVDRRLYCSGSASLGSWPRGSVLATSCAVLVECLKTSNVVLVRRIFCVGVGHR